MGKRGLGAAAAATAVLVLTAAVASAQSTGSGSDLRRLRSDVIKGLPAPGLPPGLRPTAVAPEEPVTLTFTNGFTYNTNPNELRSAKGAAKEADWHDTPDLELDFDRQVAGKLRLSASFDVNTDRYLRTVSANNDEIWGQLRLAYADGPSTSGETSAWVPYVANKLNVDNASTFRKQSLRYDDLFAGLTRSYGFAEDWRPAAGPAAQSLNVDLNAGRREARIAAGFGVSPGSGTFIRLKLGYSCRLGETLALGLAPAVETTFRDAGGAESPARTDVLLLGVAALSWTPAWLNLGPLRGGAIDLSLQGATNASTRSAAQFRQADLGPFFSFLWTF